MLRDFYSDLTDMIEKQITVVSAMSEEAPGSSPKILARNALNALMGTAMQNALNAEEKAKEPVSALRPAL